MGCKQTNNRSVGVISVVWGVKAALTFFSTQRGGHLGHFRTTPRTHRATGVRSRDAGGRVSEPGLHGLSDLPLRSVFLWGDVTPSSSSSQCSKTFLFSHRSPEDGSHRGSPLCRFHWSHQGFHQRQEVLRFSCLLIKRTFCPADPELYTRCH